MSILKSSNKPSKKNRGVFSKTRTSSSKIPASTLDQKLERSNNLFQRLGNKNNKNNTNENSADRNSNEYRIGWLEGKLEYQIKHKAILAKTSKDSAEAKLLIGRLHSAHHDFKKLNASQLLLNRSTQHLSDQLQQGVKTAELQEIRSGSYQEKLEKVLQDAETACEGSENALKNAEDAVTNYAEATAGLVEQAGVIDEMAMHNQDLLNRTEDNCRWVESIEKDMKQSLQSTEQILLERMQAYKQIESDVKKAADAVRLSYQLVEDSLQEVSESQSKVDNGQQTLQAGLRKIEECCERVEESFLFVDQSHQQVDECRQRVDESYQKVEESRQQAEQCHQQVKQTSEQMGESLLIAEECQRQVILSQERVMELAREAQERVATANEKELDNAMFHQEAIVLLDNMKEVSTKTASLAAEKAAKKAAELSSERAAIIAAEKAADTVAKKVAEDAKYLTFEHQALLDRTESILDEVQRKNEKVEKLARTTHHNVQITSKQQQKLEKQIEESIGQKAKTTEAREEITRLKLSVEHQAAYTQAILVEVEAGIEKNAIHHESIAEVIEQAQGLDTKLQRQLGTYIDGWQLQSKLYDDEQQQKQKQQTSELNDLKYSLFEQVDILEQQVNKSLSGVDLFTADIAESVNQSQILVDENKSLNIEVQEALSEINLGLACVQGMDIKAQNVLNAVESALIDARDEFDEGKLAQIKLQEIEERADQALANSDKNKNIIVSTLKQAHITAVKCNRINEHSAELLDRVKQSEELNRSHYDVLRAEISEILDRTLSLQQQGQAAQSQMSVVMEQVTAKGIEVSDAAERCLTIESSINNAVCQQQSDQVEFETRRTDELKDFWTLRDSAETLQQNIESQVDSLNQQGELVQSKLLQIDEMARRSTALEKTATAKVDASLEEVAKLKTSFDEARIITLGNINRTTSLHDDCISLNQDTQQTQHDIKSIQIEIEQVRDESKGAISSVQTLSTELLEDKTLYEALVVEVKEAKEETSRINRENHAVLEQGRSINSASIDALENSKEAEAHIDAVEKKVNDSLEHIEAVCEQTILGQVAIETATQSNRIQIAQQNELLNGFRQKLLTADEINAALDVSLSQAQDLNEEHLSVKNEIDVQLTEAREQNVQSQIALDLSLEKQVAYKAELATAQQDNELLTRKLEEFELGLKETEAASQLSNQTNRSLRQKLIETEKVNQDAIQQLDDFRRSNTDFGLQIEEAQARNTETKLSHKESVLENKENRLILRELRNEMNELRQQAQKSMSPIFPANDVPAMPASVSQQSTADVVLASQQRILQLEQELIRLKTDPGLHAPLVSTVKQDDVDERKSENKNGENSKSVNPKPGSKGSNIRNFTLSTLIAVSLIGASQNVGYSNIDHSTGDFAQSIMHNLPKEDVEIVATVSGDMQQLEILLERAFSASLNSISMPASGKISITAQSPEILSYQWPVESVSMEASVSVQKSRNGLLLVAEKGSPVLAINRGRVVYSGAGIRGFGNLIIVEHEGELLSVYGNNENNRVIEGDLVSKGQVIGTVGKASQEETGLYFEIRYQGEVEDPYLYFAAS